MKKVVCTLPLALALLVTSAQAQYAYSYRSSTGDATLDAVLDTINLLYNDEPDYYVEQIVYETQAPPVYVREYIQERRYAPADVYMIGELSQLSGKSFNDVARTFDTNRARGWGVVAKELGIKPGSAQFHALKNGTTVFVERGRGKRDKGRVVGVTTPQPAATRVARPGHGPKPGHGNDKGRGQGKGKDKGGKGKGKGKP